MSGVMDPLTTAPSIFVIPAKAGNQCEASAERMTLPRAGLRAAGFPIRSGTTWRIRPGKRHDTKAGSAIV